MKNKTYSLANICSEMPIVGLSNDFQISSDNWVQVAPYGEYPHPGPKGKNGKPLKPNGCLQRYDKTSALAMVNEFDSWVSKIGQKLFGGRAWYIGHHDVDPVKYPDPKAYGWIMKLANRDDGLYVLIDWTPEGEKLKGDKAFKFFSPYWNVRETKEVLEDGRTVVVPIRLNSIGFTNEPNIPVIPLANEEEKRTETTIEVAADMVVSKYIELGVLNESDREEWVGFLDESFLDAAWALSNAKDGEAARKGWEKRRAMEAHRPKAAVKAAINTVKVGRATKAARSAKEAVEAKPRAALRSAVKSFHRQ